MDKSTVNKTDKSAVFAFLASSAQRRLWSLAQINVDDPAYNIAIALRIKGDLNTTALQTALNHLVQRHESLRTCFKTQDGQVMQVISEQLHWPIEQTDLSALAGNKKQQALTQKLETVAQTILPLDTAPLGCVHLIQLEAQQNILLFVFHHIITDAWSMQVLTRELIVLYQSMANNIAPSLPPLNLQYADYSHWQEKWLQGKEASKQLDFWRKQLKGLSEPVLLEEHAQQNSSDQHYGRQSLQVTNKLAVELQMCSKKQQVTQFTLLLAVFNILLSRYTGHSDVSLGTSVTGRSRSELEGVVGFFVNTLVLRSHVSESMTFNRYLQKLWGDTQDAFAHQDMPFHQLIEALQPQRRANSTPWFQIMFGVQEAEQSFSADSLDFEPIQIDNGSAKFDLNITLLTGKQSLQIMAEYDAQLYSQDFIQRFLQSYSSLLYSVAQDSSQLLSQLSLLSIAEHQAILQQKSSKTHVVTGNLALSFQRFAVEQANAIAVSYEGEALPYAELNKRANQLAHALLAQGVVAESPVGLSSQPSLHLLIGVLGILKAGGCYVPLDPQQPEQRLSFVCHDANIRWIVADTVNIKLQKNLKSDSISWLNLEGDQLSGFSDSNPNIPVSPQQLAYIIYTSGSTGTPKGVGISHAQVLRLFSACEAHFEFTPDDVWSLFHAYSFDFSVWEIWGALLYGGRVAVVPYQTRRSPEAFSQLICNEKITVLSQTPSAFYGLSEVLLNLSEATPLALRYLVFGGEALDAGRLLDWFKAKGDEKPQLINMYGITETTVHVSYKRIKLADAKQPQGNAIGRPLDDLQAYVLDRQQQLLPLGVAGELYIGGAGIGRGYLARPGLTAERFIPDVFSGRADARLYKTGDQAVCLADGSLRYLGRLDQQVQLRGFRIELGEIEARIREIAGITDVAVMLREDVGAEPLLVAYLTGAIDETTVRQQLANALPDYMLPARYVVMQVLPLTINGKLDRNALPKPDAIIESQSHTAPRTETEQQLAQIWGELLGLENIGVHDNFFSLGGDSILCIQVAHRARSQGIAINPAQLFEHQTIAELASLAPAGDTKLFATHASPRAFALVNIDDKQLNSLHARFSHIDDIYPLTPLQKGLWFHSIEQAQTPLYIEQLRIELTGELALAHFASAWQWVQNRYSALRSVFVWEAESEPLQIILTPEQVELPLVVLDWRHYSKSEQAKKYQDFLQDDYQQNFDFAQAPLMRFSLIRLSEQHYQFVWTHHHLLMDGWSLRLLIKDWLSSYQSLQAGNSTPMKPEPGYRDYLAWLNNRDPQSSIAFWQKTLADFKQANAFPAPATENNNSQSSLTLELNHADAETVVGFGKQQQLTLNTLISGAWALLLARYSGEQDIVFGATFAGRPVEVINIEQGVGLFINTLPVRTQFAPEQKLGAWLQTLQSHYIDIQNHQAIPLSKVQQVADLASGQTLFNSLLVFENYPADKALDNIDQHLQISDIHYSDSTHYPLTLIASSHQQIRLRINYAHSLLNDQQAKTLVDQLQTILLTLAKTAPQTSLATIDFLSDSDKAIWFEDWNQQTQLLPNKTVVTRFQAQAEQHPQAIAFIADNEQISYDNLNARANRVAHSLLKQGIGIESRVGILLARGVDWLTTVLGILKAGAVYVPIDPDYPVQRIDSIASDAKLKLLIADSHWHNKLDADKHSIIWLDDLRALSNVMSAENPVITVLPKNLAYIIYTSGSSGQPKGVAISHHALENLVNWHIQAYQVVASDRASFVAGLGFDASVWELWPYLSAGASVVVADDNTRLSPPDLMNWLDKQAISISFIPTPIAEHLLSREWPESSSLRYLLTGGDRLHTSQHNGSFTLANNYGPTENAVVSTVAFIKSADSIPAIGQPILNTEIFILDKWMNLMPKGVAGELYLGGESLARGYSDLPSLTAERFVPHPFSRNKGERLYRTGDRVQLDDDKQLLFLGRIDTQIQFKGLRIEANEVETALKQYSAIAQVIVSVWDETENISQLVAYFTTLENCKVDVSILRPFLQQRLPRAMVPTLFIPLQAFTLTANGKIDRTRLPSPKNTLLSKPKYIAPSNAKERILCEIWQKLLKHGRISVRDDFFSLGGDSIICMQMLNNAEAQGIVLTVQQVFEQPTIEALASISESATSRSKPAYNSNPIGSDIEQVIKNNYPDAENAYPLAPLQKGFLFHALATPTSNTYIQQLDIELSGHCQPMLFQRAWQQVLNRHEILRTAFIWEALEEPMQVVLPQAKLIFSYLDWSQIDLDSAQAQLATIAKTDSEQAFDFKAPPLMRLRLCQLPEINHQPRWHLVLTHHHILLDGWSMGLLFSDVFRLYTGLLENSTPSLPELRPYSDYLLWLKSQDKQQARDFWQTQLANISEPTYLATRTHAENNVDQRIRHEHQFDPSFSTDLQRYASDNGITLNTVMQSGWALLLSRLTRQRHIVFGATTAGRPPELSGIEGTVGLFINTLAVAVTVNPNQQVAQWLKGEQQANAKRLSYSYLPLNEVQSLSALPDNQPLFDSLYVFENYPAERLAESEQTDFEVLQVKTSHWTHYPLSLVIVPGERISLRISYQSSCFDTGFTETITRQYQQLLMQIISCPEMRIGALHSLDNNQYQNWLSKARGAQLKKATENVLQLFEAQVRKTPNQPAVTDPQQTLSYLEFNQYANQIANILVRRGVAIDDIVGICMPRSIHEVASLLAIHKAGAGFMVLDPASPIQHQHRQIIDAGIKVLLGESDNESQFTDLSIEQINIKTAVQPLTAIENINRPVLPEQLAYVIYTSGSTGTPKGVQISQRSLANHQQWVVESRALTSEDRVLHKTALNFDGALWEVFAPLSVGARIIIASQEIQHNPMDMLAIIKQHKVSVAQFVPSLLNALIEMDQIGLQAMQHSLRLIAMGGEPLPESLVAKLKNYIPNAVLHNVYGPTEATVDANFWIVKPDESPIPIGHPVTGVNTYVLDQAMQPCDTGVTGELYISGIGVARGYLGRAGLTAERFLPDPFSEMPGARMYRSGDLVSSTSTGALLFKTRNDNQIKLRGVRIEPGEIEAVLGGMQNIQQVAVVLQEMPSGAQLVAYLVGTEPDIESIRTELTLRLPEAMCPTHYICLSELPLLTNGKLNYHALPAVDVAQTSDNYNEPVTPLQQQLCIIFQQVLKVTQVGIDDSFFALGGDSILSIQVTSKARMQGIELTPAQLFEHQTVKKLAEQVKQITLTSTIAEADEDVSADFSLTPVQHWFFEQSLANRNHWNQAVLLEMDSPLQQQLLQASLQALVKHHDALRLEFNHSDSSITQHYAEVDDSRQLLEYHDFSDKSIEDQDGLVAEHNKMGQSKLNITKSPLLRAVYYHLSPTQDDRLLLVIHHLAVDGVSWRILFEDLQNIYQQVLNQQTVKLPAKTHSFKHWSRALNHYADSQALGNTIAYWLRLENLAVKSLPLDKQAGHNLIRDIKSVNVSLDEIQTKQLLHQLPAVYNTRINDVLLASLSQTLGHWLNSEQVLITLEGHGREALFPELDVTRTVGWFTSIFPVLLTVASTPDRALIQTKECLRQLPDNGIGFGILRYLSSHADRFKELPEAQISFNYLGQFDSSFDQQQAFARPLANPGYTQDDSNQRQHLIDVGAHISQGQLQLSWAYSADCFDHSTIQLLAESYISNLQALIEHCLSRTDVHYTPSDFPDADLDEAELDNLFDALEK